MYGRYGNDQLNMVLVLLSLALYLVFVVTSWTFLYAVSFMLMAVALFRCLSRNYDRRRAENGKFLSLVQPVTRWYRLRRTIRRDKDHCYFKCPNCGEEHHIYGESHIEELAKKYQVKQIAKLPIDPVIATAVDGGAIEACKGEWLDAFAKAILE